MPTQINLPSFCDPRGNLTVLEDQLGFEIKRLFFIDKVPPQQKRGGHGHFVARQFLICLSGSCKIEVIKKNFHETYLLDKSNIGLLLEPEDWHAMHDFTADAVLLVVSSQKYDPKDYFTVPEV